MLYTEDFNMHHYVGFSQIGHILYVCVYVCVCVCCVCVRVCVCVLRVCTCVCTCVLRVCVACVRVPIPEAVNN